MPKVIYNKLKNLMLHRGLAKSPDPYSYYNHGNIAMRNSKIPIKTLGLTMSQPRSSSTFLSNNKYIKNSKSIRLIGSLSTLSLLILTFLLIFPVVIKSDIAEGTSGVEEVPTLTMVVGQESANLDLIVRSSSGTFATTDTSSSVAFSVKTNNYTGYTLNVRGSYSDDNKNKVLTNTNTGDTLESIKTAVDIDTFTNSTELDDEGKPLYTNKWGYLPSKLNSKSNTNYQPAPTKTDTLLDETDSANTTANTYTIGLGARIDYTVPSGLYTNTYTLEAVANYVAYTINYYDGINEKAIGSQASKVNTAATVTLSPTYTSGSAPARATYTFKSWCLGTVNTTTIANTNASGKVTSYSNPATVCNGTEYSTGANMPIGPTVDNTDIKLYAVWSPTTFDTAYQQVAASTGDSTITNKISNSYQMQKMNKDICAKVTPNQYTTLADSRDNTTYVVGKLEDNRCWMVDNLNIDLYNTTLANLQGKTNATNAQLNYLKGVTKGTTSDQYATDGINSVNSDSNHNWNSGSSYSVPLQNRSGACVPGKNNSIQCLSPYQGNNYNYSTVISKGGTPGSDSSGTANITVNIGIGNYLVGTFYNYCAVSAGTYCYGNDTSAGSHTESTNYNINNDICPSNWRLPRGGNETDVTTNKYNEFRELYIQIANNYVGSNNAATANDPMSFQAKLSAVFSGTYAGVTAARMGVYLSPWSSTYSKVDEMYGILSRISDTDFRQTLVRSDGRAVRCIAQN